MDLYLIRCHLAIVPQAYRTHGTNFDLVRCTCHGFPTVGVMFSPYLSCNVTSFEVLNTC